MNSLILSMEVTRVNNYKLVKQVVWGFLGIIYLCGYVHTSNFKGSSYDLLDN